ncbi:hypothetical protein HDU89_001710, partial [Geranomyces variabilis]
TSLATTTLLWRPPFWPPIAVMACKPSGPRRLDVCMTTWLRPKPLTGALTFRTTRLMRTRNTLRRGWKTLRVSNSRNRN